MLLHPRVLWKPLALLLPSLIPPPLPLCPLMVGWTSLLALHLTSIMLLVLVLPFPPLLSPLLLPNILFLSLLPLGLLLRLLLPLNPLTRALCLCLPLALEEAR